MTYNKLTTEGFIKRAKEKFGNRFVYDKTEFVNRKSKVIIKCKKHGYFKVTPNSFLSKGCTQGGCKGCRNNYLSNKFRLNIDELILRFNKKHNNKYDYSKIEYKNVKNTIIIKCPIHGYFKQTAGSHLKSGCKKCSDLKKGKKRRLYNKESFIEISKNIWGNKFDYSLFEYNGIAKKSIFICKEHNNKIYQICRNHLRKQLVCKLCEAKKNKNKFIKKALKKFNNKYNYDYIDYKNHYSEIKVICKYHGEYITTPSKHLHTNSKNQCPVCLFEIRKNKVLKKFKKIHGERYDYSQMDFKRTNKKIKIICNEHGIFYMTPDNHIAGKNCNKCVKYNPKFVKGKKAYLYLLKINLENDVAIKFGKTHYLKKRIQTIKRKLKGNLNVLYIYKSLDKNINKAESDIKYLLSKERNYIDKKIMKTGFTETIHYNTNNMLKLFNYCDSNKHLKKVKSLEKHFV